jgi:hypothetical protein
VQEAVIAITEGGARPLSPLAGPDLAVIGA